MAELPEYTVASEEHLRQLTLHAQQVKMDIEKETNRRSRGNNSRRREERLRKKLGEFSSRIVLASPSLPLKLYHQVHSSSALNHTNETCKCSNETITLREDWSLL